jgi:pimeloyl-ACP methyl ester carboxylesterase
MSTSTRTGFIPVQGGELYYEVAGEGSAVVLLHAGVADLRMWQYQFPDFSRSHFTIAFDARGYGRSSTESVSFSNRQDVLAVMDYLQINRAAVIGVSRGGQIAIDFTLEFPQRVAALLPVAAGLSGFEYTPTGSAREQVEWALNEQMEKLFQQGDFTALAQMETQYWGDGILQPDGRMPAGPRRLLAEMTLNNHLRKDGDATPQPLQPPAAPRLGEIHCPTLILHGDLDESLIETFAIYMEERISGARRILYPGVAHMLSMEIPEKFNQDVLAFLSTIHW